MTQKFKNKIISRSMEGRLYERSLEELEKIKNLDETRGIYFKKGHGEKTDLVYLPF